MGDALYRANYVFAFAFFSSGFDPVVIALQYQFEQKKGKPMGVNHRCRAVQIAKNCLHTNESVHFVSGCVVPGVFALTKNKNKCGDTR